MIVISPLFKVKTNFNIKEKDLVCLISCISLHFEKWAGNQSKWVKLKTDTHRANEWNIEAVFFSARKEMAFTKPPLWSQIWADICCTLYFPNKNHWIELPLIYMTIFFHLIINNTCHNLFDTNWHTLVKQYSSFFHQAFLNSSWQHGQ